MKKKKAAVDDSLGTIGHPEPIHRMHALYTFDVGYGRGVCIVRNILIHHQTQERTLRNITLGFDLYGGGCRKRSDV